MTLHRNSSSSTAAKIASPNESTPLLSSSINSSTNDSDADVEDNYEL